jgi:hypothetical protein
MNLYKVDHAKSFAQGQYMAELVDMYEYDAKQSSNFFAANKDLSEFKQGKRIRITDIETGAQSMGKVAVAKNGIPQAVQTDDGKFMQVVGLLIEILPLLKMLVITIKDIFKRKK